MIYHLIKAIVLVVAFMIYVIYQAMFYALLALLASAVVVKESVRFAWAKRK